MPGDETKKNAQAATEALDAATHAEREFTIWTLEQDDVKQRILQQKNNLSKRGRDGRTTVWRTKISEKVVALIDDLTARDGKMRESSVYEGSDYRTQGVFEVILKIQEEIETWLEKECGKQNVVPNAANGSGAMLRTFYYSMITGYMDEFGQSEMEEGDIDCAFVLDRVENAFGKFIVHHELIIDLVDDATRLAWEEERNSLSDRILKFSTSLLGRTDSSRRPDNSRMQIAPQQQPPATNASIISTPPSTAPLTLEAVVAALTTAHTPKSDFRLPRMDLPKFDGTPDKWRDFKERFVALVHDNKKLSPVEKMSFLKLSLTDTAQGTIKNMSLTQYEEAWAAVLRRFHNEKVLIYNAFSRLFALPSANEKAGELKHLLDSVKVIRFDLTHFGENVEEYNSLFVYLVTTRLSKDTYELWEQSCNNKREIQPFHSLDDFLENRILVLQQMEKSFSKASRVVAAAAVKGSSENSPPEKGQPPCSFCNGNHPNFKCHLLRNVNVAERLKMVQGKSLCCLCLKAHSVDSCKVTWRCRVCKERHNTSLHVDKVASQLCNTNQKIRLATAQMTIKNGAGRELSVRALIDQGSEANFVSEKASQFLRLARSHSDTAVTGVGGIETRSRGITEFHFHSKMQPELKFVVEADIFSEVAANLKELGHELPSEFAGLSLADRNWWKGGPVDIVLGAGVHADIILGGMKKANVVSSDPPSVLQCSHILAQESHLGWLISGRTRGTNTNSIRACMASVDKLDEKMKRFWETEEKISPTPAWTQEQQDADKFYEDTTTRDSSGRYVCRLPIKPGSTLGCSRRSAVACLFKLERDFEKNADLKKRYVASMDEYFSLGHAVPAQSPPPVKHCYLPHLAVIKEESLTTKTRVVFNASSATSNKRSLNDNLLVGPVVQRDLVENMMRFRMHPFVFACDIEKMYRQISIQEQDQEYQRFLWRSNASEPIREYKLTTVTFGEASAPFTATRTLVKLAQDIKDKFPLASSILLGETYVDDLHFGSKSTEELLLGCRQLIQALSTAGFLARKYSTNYRELVDSLPEELVNKEPTTRFLGIVWDTEADNLKFPPAKMDSVSELTKREFLSNVSSLFDPLGWVQPLIVPAKILMQSLWKLNLKWSDKLPVELQEQWREIVKTLQRITEFSIPRWISFEGGRVELHGFCDASEKAYGAVIYLRTESGVKLLVSKSRVAPIELMSIARLELKGAVLLAELMDKVRQSFSDMSFSCINHCDSRVTLYWVNGEPSKWKPFIRNRTTFIRQLSDKENWFYVKSADNPADLVSRGCTFDELQNNSLWLNGPDWLSTWTRPEDDCPAVSVDEENTIATETVKPKLVSAVACTQDSSVMTDLLERHSSFAKLCRVIGWMYRFTRNTAGPVAIRDATLSVDELWMAEMVIIKFLQNIQFADEIARLRAGKTVSRRSRIKDVSPFLDHEGILRVGGRLEKAHLLPYEQKHPMILLYHPILNSVIKRHHIAVCHSGPTLTLGNLRKRYWLVNGMQLVKKWIRGCLICFRYRPMLMKQLMASLPSPRLSLTKSFTHVGVDFAGPLTLKAEVGRGSRNYKAYIAVFVCLATKAIHLEVVGSLSAESFLAALRRFVGRRGPVAHFYSDNATNNVGVFRQLDGLQKSLCDEGIEWSFIPPAAPHFGGLWEAGVKSMKTLLKKILGLTTCTFEEMSTVMVQIEATLNMRPLCPFSGDVEDLTALSPMHFLTGHQYVPLPDETLLEGCQLLKRYNYLQSLFHEFCRRYQEEYLSRLQQRPKWLGPKKDPEVGQLVLIKEENKISIQWALGRIIELHPGTDGHCRVVTLLTKDGLKKRPIVKIAPLPLDSADTLMTDEDIARIKSRFSP